MDDPDATPPELPEDPTSLEGLARSSMVIVHGFAGYQRDSLSQEERDAWDARVQALGGQIVHGSVQSEGLRPGRRVAGSHSVSYYLVPEIRVRPPAGGSQ
jgi:hypothetical protein